MFVEDLENLWFIILQLDTSKDLKFISSRAKKTLRHFLRTGICRFNPREAQNSPLLASENHKIFQSTTRTLTGTFKDNKKVY